MENEFIFACAGIALVAAGAATAWARRPLRDALPPHPATGADTAAHAIREG